MAGNVQDKITMTFTKTAVELTHPSGVKVTNTKEQVQAIMNGLQRQADHALAQKAELKSTILDKIDASVVVAGR
jgi:hypothetical protein